MNQHELILERMRAANPVPELESIPELDLVAASSLLEERRLTMPSTTQARRSPTPTKRSSRRRLIAALAFATGLVAALIAFGSVALLNRSGDSPVATSPTSLPTTTSSVPPTTEAPTVTTEPEAAVVDEAPPEVAALGTGGEMTHQVAFGDIGSVVAVPGGGFLAVGLPGTHAMYSVDGLDWRDADPEGVIETDAGWVDNAVALGDRVIVAGHTCEGEGDFDFEPFPCRPEMGIWAGQPAQGNWQRIPVDTADLSSCENTVTGECYASIHSLAASPEGLLALGTTTRGTEADGYRSDESAWVTDPTLDEWRRGPLPTLAEIAPPLWIDRAEDSQWWVGVSYGPAGWVDGQWIIQVAIDGWNFITDEEEAVSLLLVSEDASSWQSIGDGPTAVREFATGPSGIVAIGATPERAAIWRSPNGLDWEDVDFDEQIELVDVEYSPEFGFVAVGLDEGLAEGAIGPDLELLLSTDGRIWYPAGHAGQDDLIQEPRRMAINGVTIVVSGGQWRQPGQGESEGEYGDGPPTFGVWRWQGQ